jgi:hypothetical protein
MCNSRTRCLKNGTQVDVGTIVPIFVEAHINREFLLHFLGAAYVGCNVNVAEMLTAKMMT